MGRYFWPVLVLLLALSVAGAWRWRAYPRLKASAGPVVSSFCTSFAEEFRRAWARLTTRTTPDDMLELIEWPEDETAHAGGARQFAAMLANDDPDPSTLTPEQRKRKHDELLAAAKARKLEVLRANLMKSQEGRDALKATLAYRAKADEMKRLEAKHGAADDRLWSLRLELAPLKDEVAIANARYKTWKDAHPSEVVDPSADETYRDLITRSRFYAD